MLFAVARGASLCCARGFLVTERGIDGMDLCCCPPHFTPHILVQKEIVEFDPTRDAKVSVVDECDYHIEIKSALACPLCSNASYTWSLGECKGNKMQTKTWVLKEGICGPVCIH